MTIDKAIEMAEVMAEETMMSAQMLGGQTARQIEEECRAIFMLVDLVRRAYKNTPQTPLELLRPMSELIN